MGVSSRFADTGIAASSPVIVGRRSMSAKRLNSRTRISAACESEAWGVVVPSVSISRLSLSKLVIWPTRVFSTEKFTRRTGEKMASTGMTPIGMSSVCSAGR